MSKKEPSKKYSDATDAIMEQVLFQLKRLATTADVMARGEVVDKSYDSSEIVKQQEGKSK